MKKRLLAIASYSLLVLGNSAIWAQAVATKGTAWVLLWIFSGCVCFLLSMPLIGIKNKPLIDWSNWLIVPGIPSSKLSEISSLMVSAVGVALGNVAIWLRFFVSDSLLWGLFWVVAGIHALFYSLLFFYFPWQLRANTLHLDNLSDEAIEKKLRVAGWRSK